MVGFALAFPLIAYIFLATTDLTLTVLQREKTASMTEQLLRNGVRVPSTDNLSDEIELILRERGYEVEIAAGRSIQNTAELIFVEAITEKFRAHLYGVSEQSNE